MGVHGLHGVEREKPAAGRRGSGRYSGGIIYRRQFWRKSPTSLLHAEMLSQPAAVVRKEIKQTSCCLVRQSNGPINSGSIHPSSKDMSPLVGILCVRGRVNWRTFDAFCEKALEAQDEKLGGGGGFFISDISLSPPRSICVQYVTKRTRAFFPESKQMMETRTNLIIALCFFSHALVGVCLCTSVYICMMYIYIRTTQQVDKLEFVQHVLRVSSDEGRNAEMALYRRCPDEAESILLQASPPLIYRAIKLNVCSNTSTTTTATTTTL